MNVNIQKERQLDKRILFISEASPEKPVHFACGIDKKKFEVIYRYNNGFERSRYNRSLFIKIIEKFTPWIDLRNFNKRIEEVATKGNFDLIIVIKGWFLLSKTLASIQNSSTVILWSSDDLSLNHNRNSILRTTLNKYDLVVTTKDNVGALRFLGCRNILFQDQAYSPCFHHPTHLEKFTYLNDYFIFIGSFERERSEYLEALSKSGIPILIWGSGWEQNRLLTENGSFQRSTLINEEYCAAISASRGCLNFLRKLNNDNQTNRTFEIVACGGLMISQRTEKQESFFRDGYEALYFDDPEGLVTVCKRVLSSELDEEQIKNKARARLHALSASYADRLSEIVGLVK